MYFSLCHSNLHQKETSKGSPFILRSSRDTLFLGKDSGELAEACRGSRTRTSLVCRDCYNVLVRCCGSPCWRGHQNTYRTRWNSLWNFVNFILWISLFISTTSESAFFMCIIYDFVYQVIKVGRAMQPFKGGRAMQPFKRGRDMLPFIVTKKMTLMNFARELTWSLTLWSRLTPRNKTICSNKMLKFKF